MVRHLAAVSLFIVTSCFVVACSGSDSSGGDANGGGKDGGGGGGGGNATSTGPERDTFCTLAVSKCHPYQDKVGNCTVDHTNVASCYVTFMTECVKKISSSPCDIDDFDGCMKEGALHCDGSASPKYWKDCMDKDKACKSKGEVDEGAYIAIEDTCNLLRALDANGRADGAECVAGPCDRLEDCLARITP
ncbi:hypothetical protein LVJ94_29865 [Pendulispora rubella]|uniref:Extracellular membrane protein CFEM domain-containing protein n=1 Tax=Pendulispora rubella TaxID=2741070 RepID=A0ABZ2KR30_9BACT